MAHDFVRGDPMVSTGNNRVPTSWNHHRSRNIGPVMPHSGPGRLPGCQRRKSVVASSIKAIKQYGQLPSAYDQDRVSRKARDDHHCLLWRIRRYPADHTTDCIPAAELSARSHRCIRAEKPRRNTRGDPYVTRVLKVPSLTIIRRITSLRFSPSDNASIPHTSPNEKGHRLACS